MKIGIVLILVLVHFSLPVVVPEHISLYMLNMSNKNILSFYKFFSFTFSYLFISTVLELFSELDLTCKLGIRHLETSVWLVNLWQPFVKWFSHSDGWNNFGAFLTFSKVWNYLVVNRTLPHNAAIDFNAKKSTRNHTHLLKSSNTSICGYFSSIWTHLGTCSVNKNIFQDDTYRPLFTVQGGSVRGEFFICMGGGGLSGRPPPVDRHLWNYYLAPNFVCGR